MDSVAMELQNRCPICLESWEEASYVMPCLHQFCYPCIVRWAESKPECPLCKRTVSSILHSVRADNDFQEVVIAPAAAAQPAAAGPRFPAPVGGFYASVWAFIFRVYPSVLQALLPWLHQELGQLYPDAQEAAAVQSLILSRLRCFGLDEEALIQLLQDSLGRHTRSFVQQLLETIVQRCGGEARRQMGLEDARAAEERQGSPAAAPSPAASPGGSSAPRPELRGRPGSSPSAPGPSHVEPEEPREEPEEVVARPSARRHSSQRSPGRARRAPKRRASEPEEPSPPHKKPPRRRH